jgi:hypothetical protein
MFFEVFQVYEFSVFFFLFSFCFFHSETFVKENFSFEFQGIEQRFVKKKACENF